jgi:hypothetical protein
MSTVPKSAWNNATTIAAVSGGGDSDPSSSSLLNFDRTGSQKNNNNSNNKNNPTNTNNKMATTNSTISNNNNNSNTNMLAVSNNPNAGSSSAGGAGGENEGWSRGGRQFASSREVYTRALFRVCLKFTTSEDEDEGKPEPGTAFWTLYGRHTTIGNGAASSHNPDNICRRMDDSMTGPSAGILARLSDFDGEQAAGYAMRSGMTTGWHIRGDRGDAAVRVGKAKIFSGKSNGPDGPMREAQILSLDADRWILCKGASFAAGNSVFNVEDVNEGKQKITIHCSKGPMRGKLIDIHASRCPFVFGRAHEADLCIMDRELSRKHGAIVYIPNRKNNRGGAKPASIGSFVLVDLESTVSLLLIIIHLFFIVTVIRMI